MEGNPCLDSLPTFFFRKVRANQSCIASTEFHFQDAPAHDSRSQSSFSTSGADEFSDNEECAQSSSCDSSEWDADEQGLDFHGARGFFLRTKYLWNLRVHCTQKKVLSGALCDGSFSLQTSCSKSAKCLMQQIGNA